MVKISKNDFLKSVFLDNVLIVVLFALLGVIVLLSPDFISINNFTNILAQSSTKIIIALGIGGLIITQGTDLSAGRLVGLTAVVAASLSQAVGYQYRMYPDLPELPIICIILLVVIIGAIFGAVNGLFISKFEITPFITTLGMMIVTFGITSIYFDRPPYGAQPIGGLSDKFTEISQGTLNILGFNLPYLIIYATIVTLIIYFIWNHTKLGKNMYAIGGNPEAAVVSGVNVNKNLIILYSLAGALYGLAGALEAARVGSATNNTGNMYELDAIAAVVVGGVSFKGGIGTVPGVVIGVLMFQVINYGLAYIGVNPYYQYIIKGAIIVLAVGVDIKKNKRKK